MGSEGVLAEMALRLEQLSRQLLQKDTELSHAQARVTLLERELQSSKAETRVARDELQREALEGSLKAQRLTAQQEQTQQLAAQLHEIQAALDTRERTLCVVQQEFTQAQQRLAERTRELAEKTSFYDSVLEAKESSISSLQQLLHAQTQAAQDQQRVWEDELQTLRDALRAAQVYESDARADDQQLRGLKTRVLQLEQDNHELTKRCKHLQTHLRERERLLVKADKRYQELTRRFNSTQQVPSAAVVSGHRAAEQAVRASQGTELHSQLLLLQDAFKEEQRRQERLEAKYSAKSKECIAVCTELESVRQQLAEVQRRQEGAGEEAEKKVALLRAELEAMQARHASTTAALQAAHDAALAQERQQAATVQEALQAQLERLTGPRSLEDQAVSALLQSSTDRLQQQLAAKTAELTQLQHSVYLVRAHWGGLKRHVLGLQEQCVESEGVCRALQEALDAAGSTERDIASALRASDASSLTKSLMQDWDPSSHKPHFDTSVEESLRAAGTILEQSLTAWQGLVQQSTHAARALAVSTTAAHTVSAAPQPTHTLTVVHPLLEAAHMELQQARAQASAADRAATTARVSAAEADERLASAQNQVSALQREVLALQDAREASERESRSAQEQLKQLRTAMQGSKGEMESLLSKRDAELSAAKRTIDDLQTTVGVLHVRLEHTQRNLAQVDELKTRLSSIMASPLTIPSLVPTHTTNTHADKPQTHTHTPSPLDTLLDKILTGGQGKETSVRPVGESVIAAGDESSVGVQKRLDKALEQLISEAQAALAGCAAMETSHWEMERGLECVSSVRAHLTALQTEISAGRTSTALVLAKELAALMDTRTSATDTPSNAQQGSATQPGHTGSSKVHSDLSGARTCVQRVSGALRTMDALLRSLTHALPAWAQLTRAEVSASYKGELSRTKAVVTERAGTWIAQRDNAGAVVAQARTLLSQYLSALDNSVANLTQQLEGLRVAGGLTPDSAAHQQLTHLENSRHTFANELTRLLDTAETEISPLPPTQPHIHPADAHTHSADPPHGADAAARISAAPAGAAAPNASLGMQSHTNVVPRGYGAGQVGVDGRMCVGQEGGVARRECGVGPADSVSSRPGVCVSKGVPGSVDRLMEPVGHLQDALTSVRTDLALLQAERSALLHDKSELLRHIDSTSLRCRRLTDTLSAVLPLPPDLSQGLYDGLAGPLPAMQSTVVCEIDTVSGGYSESEEATDKMLSSSLSMLQKLTSAFLDQVQHSAASGSTASLRDTVLAPLSARCQQLEGDLRDALADRRELERQVCELVRDGEARLGELRQACQEAAQRALDTALTTLRTEVESIEGQLKALKDQSTKAIGAAGEEWAGLVTAAAQSASRAVSALSSTAATLQAQLDAEQQAHQDTRNDASESLRQAKQLHEASTAELTRTKSRLEVTQHELQLEKSQQAALESEAAELRKSVRLQSAPQVDI